MAADQAREQEPAVVDSSREAREVDREFVPDHSDRMVLFPECPAYRLNAANSNPLFVL